MSKAILEADEFMRAFLSECPAHIKKELADLSTYTDEAIYEAARKYAAYHVKKCVETLFDVLQKDELLTMRQQAFEQIYPLTNVK